MRLRARIGSLFSTMSLPEPIEPLPDSGLDLGANGQRETFYVVGYSFVNTANQAI